MVAERSRKRSITAPTLGFRAGSARITTGYGACKDTERGFERSFGDDGKDSCLPPGGTDIRPVVVRGHEGTVAVVGRLDPISVDVPDRRSDSSEDGPCYFALGEQRF